MAKPDGTAEAVAATAMVAAAPSSLAAPAPPSPPPPPRADTPPSPSPSPLPRAFAPPSATSPPATPRSASRGGRGRGASSPRSGSGSTAAAEPVVILSDGRLTGVRAGLLAQRDRQLGVDGERLSVMCIGETGVGKSTLLANLLGNASISAQLAAAAAVGSAKRGKRGHDARVASAAAAASAAASPARDARAPSPNALAAASAASPPKTLSVTATVVHILADGVPLAVTLIDSPGYGDVLNVEASFAVYTDFLEERLRESLALEESIARPADGADLRVGGVDVILYFVAPHRLKGLDVELLSRLTHLAPVVPIISKADTLTASELASFRESVAADLDRAGIAVFHPPLAVIAGPGGTRDRVYPWGTAHAENTTHSDLPALRRLLLVDGLKDLHVARRACYEAYRTRVLRRRHRGGIARLVATAARRAGLYTAVLLVVLPGMRQVLAEGVVGGATELARAFAELADAAGGAPGGRPAGRRGGRGTGAPPAVAAVAAPPRGGEVVAATGGGGGGGGSAGPLRKLWALGALLAAPLVLLLRRPPNDV